MFLSKINVLVCMAFIGATAAGCIAEDGSFSNDEDAVVGEEVGAAEETVGEVEQALDTCTQGGGGTWGNIITLCKTSNNSLYVKRHNNAKFTSSGTMKLKSWIGTLYTVNVFPGATTIHFGPQVPGWYYAYYESNAPGVAWTDEIQVK